MSRDYMTEWQNEEQKRKLREALYDRRTISKDYPEVAKIKIIYDLEHRSAFGISRESRTVLYKPDHTNNFTIDCLNWECTDGFFDLKSDVFDMIRQKQTEFSGEKFCKGSETPDYMYQSCGGSIKYSISITYIDISIEHRKI